MSKWKRNTLELLAGVLVVVCVGLLVAVTGGADPTRLQVVARSAVFVMLAALSAAVLHVTVGRQVPRAALTLSLGVAVFGLGATLAAPGALPVGLAVGIAATVGIGLAEMVILDRDAALMLQPTTSLRYQLLTGLGGLMAAVMLFAGITPELRPSSVLLVAIVVCIGALIGWWLIPGRYLPRIALTLWVITGFATFHAEGLTLSVEQQGEPDLSHMERANMILVTVVFIYGISYALHRRKQSPDTSIEAHGR